MKNFAPRRQISELLVLNFLAKFPTERKYLMNNLKFCKAKISLDEIIKSINNQTNKKSHWLKVSVNKLLGDKPSNIKMEFLGKT